MANRATKKTANVFTKIICREPQIDIAHKQDILETEFVRLIEDEFVT